MRRIVVLAGVCGLLSLGVLGCGGSGGSGGGGASSTTAPVVGIPGSPLDPQASTLRASPRTGLLANGSDGATITIELRDQSGAPMTGTSVTLSASGAGAILRPSRITTDQAGRALATLTATAAGPKQLSAAVSGVILAQTVTVTFDPVPGPAGGLPANLKATEVARLPSGQLVLSDLTAFDGRLWIPAAADPLNAPFGAGIYSYAPGSGLRTELYDAGSQGYLRAKVFGGKLYIPDGDPNGVSNGIIHIFNRSQSAPNKTVVTGGVHQFDVIEVNGELWTTGSANPGVSTVHRFNAANNRWDQISSGSFSRLKYAARTSTTILSTARQNSGIDGVILDAAGRQSGFRLSQSGGGGSPCMEAIRGNVYLTLFGNGAIPMLIEPGNKVTNLTGDAVGVAIWDYIEHSDGNLYAVGWNGKSVVLGSTDGVSWTKLLELADNRFGQASSGNADTRASIGSFGGKLYAGSSTNGRLYRLD